MALLMVQKITKGGAAMACNCVVVEGDVVVRTVLGRVGVGGAKADATVTTKPRRTMLQSDDRRIVLIQLIASLPKAENNENNVVGCWTSSKRYLTQ